MSEKAARPRWEDFGPDDLFDEHVLACLYGLSIHTVRAWRASKRGPRWVRMGSRVRYRASDARRFLDRNSVETADDPIAEAAGLRRIG